jgi:multiple sugar transport system ATP-binding protein
MAEVRLDRVTKRFGSHAAVDDLTLTIADGEFFVLLGRPAPARRRRSA